MSRSPAAQGAIDGAAVCLSALCLMHCLALPLVISIAPWIVPSAMVDERFHLWAVSLALPVSVFGITRGVRAHHHRLVIALAAIGLVGLTVGAVWAHEGWPEVLLSATGASVLAAAHLLNWRLLNSLSRN